MLRTEAALLVRTDATLHTRAYIAAELLILLIRLSLLIKMLRGCLDEGVCVLGWGRLRSHFRQYRARTALAHDFGTGRVAAARVKVL